VEIEYISQGWYKVRSLENIYYCYPRMAYCTCPSLKLMCKHIKEIFTRQQDNNVGIDNLTDEKYINNKYLS